MKKKEIKEFLKPLTKKDLQTIIELAEEQLNSTINIGDTVTLVINYMIGDADGNTDESCEMEIESQDDLDALEIIQDILDNNTKPNKGSWGFSLSQKDFAEKSDVIYNLLYNQEEAPKIYKGIKLNAAILERISNIVDECFRSDAEYSFLVYQGYDLEQ